MVSDVRASTDSLGAELRAEMRALRTELSDCIERVEQLVKEEGETTRRHFDFMVETIQDSVKIVAEATAHQTVVLDDHEARLKSIERTR
jgi:hypothetical protein